MNVDTDLKLNKPQIAAALTSGAGAESRQQIGWVIFCGLLLGTLLTLFVIPVVYSFLASRHRVMDRPPAEADSALPESQ
jgi:multidrug efflux pump